jgi:hypothetical protein
MSTVHSASIPALLPRSAAPTAFAVAGVHGMTSAVESTTRAVKIDAMSGPFSVLVRALTRQNVIQRGARGGVDVCQRQLVARTHPRVRRGRIRGHGGYVFRYCGPFATASLVPNPNVPDCAVSVTCSGNASAEPTSPIAKTTRRSAFSISPGI